MTEIKTTNGFYVAIGIQGMGKTAFITSLAINEHFANKKRLVLSNYNIRIPHISIDLVGIVELVRYENAKLVENIVYHKVTKEVSINFDTSKLNDEEIHDYTILEIAEEYKKIRGHYPISNTDYLNNSIILLDEIHIYFDAYDFLSKDVRLISAFASQLRKRNTLLLGTTQFILNLAIRLRKQAKYIFDLFKNGNLYEVTITSTDGVYTNYIDTKLVDLSSYYKYYDTNEIIRP